MIKTQDDRIIDVECAETHIFRPFSAGFETPSGAMTLVSQRMRFMGEKRGRVAASVEIGRCIPYNCCFNYSFVKVLV